LVFTGDARGNLTQHNYFAATNCPGLYLQGKFKYIAGEVNKRLSVLVAVPPMVNQPGKEDEDDMPRYTRLVDVTDTWEGGEPRATITKLVDAGIIMGTNEGEGITVDLSYDMVRMLVINTRGGCYDRRFIAEGMEPFVKA